MDSLRNWYKQKPDDMASCSSIQSEEQTFCCLCKDAITNPIATTCGHTFCKICITIKWIVEPMHCPLCQEPFFGKNELCLSQATRDAMEDFKKAEERDESSAQQCEAAFEVPCDVCQGTQLAAHKSCVDICQRSFCQTHLEPHQKDPELKTHKLTSPVFFCFFCEKVITHPISTTCGHTFCYSCIKTSWASAKKIQCPLCQKPFFETLDPKNRDSCVELIMTGERRRNWSDANNLMFLDRVADVLAHTLTLPASTEKKKRKELKKKVKEEDKLE